MSIKKIIEDAAILAQALEELVEPFQRKITNATLRVDDIECAGRSVSFTAVLAWQGDAESGKYTFPTHVVEDRMSKIRKETP